MKKKVLSLNGREAIKSLALALGLVMSGLLGNVSAEEFSGTYAGTFTENRMDLNDDGTVGGWDTARADTTIGQLNFQETMERQPVASPTGLCPTGQLEFELVFGTGVDTAADTSQIFYQIDESPVCLDPATFTFTGTAQESILGGTGRFAGATGNFESTFTGSYLVFDDSPESNQGFGPFSGSFTGDITIPNGDDGTDDNGVADCTAELIGLPCP